MNEERQVWRRWAAWLQAHGLASAAAACLEGLAPLSVLGAQVVYLGQPLFSSLVPSTSLRALARLLEMPEAQAQFLTWLEAAATDREEQQGSSW